MDLEKEKKDQAFSDYDEQDDGDFDQGEAFLRGIHG